MTKTYYSERPAETELRQAPDRALLFIRTDIKAEAEGFSAKEIISNHPKNVVVNDELIEHIKNNDKVQTISEVKAKRRELLEDSDRRMVSDFPCDHEAWANYRQALRDITEQPGYPYEIEWPIKPED